MIHIYLACLLVLAFVGLNILACRHAYCMTHFARRGTRTASPEKLAGIRKAFVLLAGVTLPRPQNVPGTDWGPHSREVSFSSADGLDIAATYVPVEPSRGIVVFLHGYTGSRQSLLAQSVFFRERGWSVLLIDFRGSGGSGGRRTTIGAKEAMDVEAAANWARGQAAGRPVMLYAVSMGAAAALGAIHHRNVKPDALILESPYDCLLTTVKHRFQSMGLPAFPSAQLLTFWGGIWTGFNAFRLNPSEFAPAATCPTLVLHGGSDPRVTVQEAEAVFRRLGGKAAFHVFDGVAHESYCQARPDEYARVVDAWLRSAFPAR